MRLISLSLPPPNLFPQILRLAPNRYLLKLECVVYTLPISSCPILQIQINIIHSHYEVQLYKSKWYLEFPWSITFISKFIAYPSTRIFYDLQWSYEQTKNLIPRTAFGHFVRYYIRNMP